jgi:hypothetical protein
MAPKPLVYARGMRFPALEAHREKGNQKLCIQRLAVGRHGWDGWWASGVARACEGKGGRVRGLASLTTSSCYLVAAVSVVFPGGFWERGGMVICRREEGAETVSKGLSMLSAIF